MAIRMTIIGAGPGGYVAALRAARMGAQVTVVEEAEVGGTCLNLGCIPTKTIIASAEALEHVRSAADFGIVTQAEAGYNLDRIRERKDKVVATQVKGIRAYFKSWGVNVIEGRGSLLSPDVVRVVQKNGTTMDLMSDKVIVATGSRPAKIAGVPFDGDNVLTSDDAVRLDKIPKSLLIVGGGVIGSEFAFIYRTFGSEVTVIDMMPRPLATEDADMSSIIEREFKKVKIKFLPNVKADRIEKDADGAMVSHLNNGQQIRTETVLVSIGRSMNTQNIGLEDIGVETGKRGEVLVNDRMETNVAGVYAIGDVTGKLMLAHVASTQGLVAVANALGGTETMDYTCVPSGIFTMPEIGSVGMREHEAIERKINYRTGTFQYRALGKAHAMGELTGMIKIIADRDTDKVLGVHICGSHATDLVHEGALAIKAGVTAKELGNTIHAHPTLAEGIHEAAEDLHGMAIHVMKK